MCYFRLDLLGPPGWTMGLDSGVGGLDSKGGWTPGSGAGCQGMV